MTAILSIATAAFGYLFSVLVEFFPWIEKWHEALTPKKKALFHASATFVIGLLVLLASCYKPLAEPLHLSCVPFTLENVFVLFLAAYGGNQMSYNTVVKWRTKDGSAAG